MEIEKIAANLIDFACANLGLRERDKNYKYNRLLDILASAEETSDTLSDELTDIIMGELSLLPSEIDGEFSKRLNEDSLQAFDWFYKYCVDNAYVKKARLDKNPAFEEDGLIVTINKAKPEFSDPKKAKEGNSVKGGYPKCVICRENEGYAPRNKRNLRTVSLRLGGEDFFWQYSPYGYFKEHGIAINANHIPMHVDRGTYEKLADFVDMAPHYFLGCNAALPGIGGSVLAHDHFQGGRQILPLQLAKTLKRLNVPQYPSVKLEIPDWPSSALRLTGENREELFGLLEDIRIAWESYSDPSRDIIAIDEAGRHNAVSPTFRRTSEGYAVDLILRNNAANERYPDGIFHAHPEFHVIKKESIGLIEAQGLFILPGRLESQLSEIEALVSNSEPLDVEHAQFALVYDELKELFKTYSGDIHGAMQKELASICRRILENTAVFKTKEELEEFLKGAGIIK